MRVPGRALIQRSLILRVYLFALACFGLVVLGLIILFFEIRSTTVRDRMQHLARGMATLLAEKSHEMHTLAPVLDQFARAGIDIAIVRSDGEVLMARGRPMPTVDAADVKRARVQAPVKMATGMLLAPMPENSSEQAAALFLRFKPPGTAASFKALLLGGLLTVLLLLSFVFARNLAVPLKQLSEAARRFGSGDLRARTGFTRGDQLGDVGRAFDEMAERITTLINANRALMGAVSHELRTPIARIRVAVDLAEEDPPAAHELLAGVSVDLAELERLIDDTLTMTRLEAASGTPPLHVEPLIPGQLADRAREGWHQRHGDRTLTIDIAADLPTVTGDPVLLRRALDNLLDNAAKYAPADTAIELRVESQNRDGDQPAICFSVIDSGPGMTEEELTQAFTPFWRSDDSRNRHTGGVGLGLPLARQLAYAHGGDIALTSAPGQGVCATLRIPLTQTRG